MRKILFLTLCSFIFAKGLSQTWISPGNTKHEMIETNEDHYMAFKHLNLLTKIRLDMTSMDKIGAYTSIRFQALLDTLKRVDIGHSFPKGIARVNGRWLKIGKDIGNGIYEFDFKDYGEYFYIWGVQPNFDMSKLQVYGWDESKEITTLYANAHKNSRVISSSQSVAANASTVSKVTSSSSVSKPATSSKTPASVALDVTTLKAVDLGLSVKWANMNVGAKSVTDNGKYFAWGEVTGCERNSDGSVKPAIMDGKKNARGVVVNSNYVSGREKTKYSSWDNYKWCKGNWDTLTKYGEAVDKKQTLDLTDDAANANLGEKWRIPTIYEYYELIKNCYWEWTDNYNGTGVCGYTVYKALKESDKGVIYNYALFSSVMFRAKGYSLSVSHIFFPMSGKRENSSFDSIGTGGYYWSSTVEPITDYRAMVLYLLSYVVSADTDITQLRTLGLSVRAVCR